VHVDRKAVGAFGLMGGRQRIWRISHRPATGLPAFGGAIGDQGTAGKPARGLPAYGRLASPPQVYLPTAGTAGKQDQRDI